MPYLCRTAAILLAAALAACREDPRELVLGDWQDRADGLSAAVDPGRVECVAAGRRGKAAYEWLQAEEEPYQIRFTRSGQAYTATISFRGRDEAVLEFPLSQFPAEARPLIRRQNKARGLPQDSLRLRFTRRKAD